MKKNKYNQILIKSIVPIIFIIITAIAAPLSGLSGNFLLEQILIRLVRNSFLVLALIIPIIAGMGINFGLTLGAMAGQIGLIFVQDRGTLGLPGILLACLIGAPIAMVLGWFSGKILNKAKGREMITSMLLSFFISGIYQFFLLYLCGWIIPFKDQRIILSRGYGVRNSLELNTAGGIDNVLDKFLTNTLGSPLYIGDFKIPIVTIIIIVALCIFTIWFKKTKLGQEMRAVGQDMEVAEESGINVDKTRLKSIIISTVLACFGQIIYLQNIGTVNVYNGADQAALFAAAALLIGGASVATASIANALFGTILFHLLFITMPLAGQTVTGSAMIGEYLRTFISYAVVTLALILHAWTKNKEKQMELTQSRNERKSERENKGKPSNATVNS